VVVQHTPLTQLPLVQSVSFMQLWPLALVALQPLAVQVFGEHVCTVGVPQLPEPLHFTAGVNFQFVVSQELAPQLLVVGA
jgi:hypothetical protein